MSPALLLPLGLAALLALAVPVVIHIARRTESRTVQFAALRWLDPQPRPRRSATIDERLLLGSRLLLLALIALWLAAPVLWKAADRRPVVAVAPGVDAATLAGASKRGDYVLWLAPGFPVVGGIRPTAGPDLVSLIRQLDAELPGATPVELVVPATLDGVDAERPSLSRQVTWTIGAEPPARRIPAPAPPALIVRYAPDAQAAVRYFRAASTAWVAADAAPSFAAEPLDRPIPSGARHLIWLASGSVPAPVKRWIRDGGVVLTVLEARAPVEGETTVVWRGTAGEPLAVAGRLGKGRVIRLTRALEPAAMPQLLEPGFPDALLSMLQPPAPPARVAAIDHAPLTGAAPYDQPPLDLRPWLALLIAAAFLAERVLATRRRRAVAP